jgi:protein-disulfide isomerase
MPRTAAPLTGRVPEMREMEMRTRALLWSLGMAFAATVVTPVAQDRHRIGSAQPTMGSDVAAVVDGDPITLAEVEQSLGVKLISLEQQANTLKRQALDDLVAARALAHEAASRHMTTEDFLLTEAAKQTVPVTEAEVDAFYQANKAKLQGQGTDDQIRAVVRTALREQRVQAAEAAVLQTLKANAHVAIGLAAPPVRRLTVNTDGAPELGPMEAPVTLVEFSDFHCPFCKSIEDAKAIAQLRVRYGDLLKVVWIDYPLDSIHPQSRAAHEAARCAGEQGRFWAYHDALYTGAPKTGDELRAAARAIGLDTAAFDACVASGRTRSAVQRGVDEARRLSVSGTPTFLVNGRPLIGAQSFEAFTQLIDEELMDTTPRPSTER